MDKTIQFLREYFDQWLSVNCDGCYACCEATRMAQQELEAILRLLAKKWYKESPSWKWIGYCEYLDTDGKCVVYEERPIFCRIKGKMDGKYTMCNKNDNFEKAVIPQPPELSDYMSNLLD